MAKGISKPAGAHEVAPVSLSELIHQHVRLAIEAAVHEELRVVLGATRAWSEVCGKAAMSF